MSRFLYAFSCVDDHAYNAELMEKLKDDAHPISYERARALLGDQLSQWAHEHGYYVKQPTVKGSFAGERQKYPAAGPGGLTLRQCNHIAFYRGWYGDHPAVLIVWSAFDFVWLAPETWHRERGVQRWTKGRWSIEASFSDTVCPACGAKRGACWLVCFDGKVQGETRTLEQAKRVAHDVQEGADRGEYPLP